MLGYFQPIQKISCALTINRKLTTQNHKQIHIQNCKNHLRKAIQIAKIVVNHIRNHRGIKTISSTLSFVTYPSIQTFNATKTVERARMSYECIDSIKKLDIYKVHFRSCSNIYKIMQKPCIGDLYRKMINDWTILPHNQY